MRTLRFIVDGQLIKQDPSCDFSGLIPGSDGYLQASFTFSDEWNEMAKVAAFWSPLGKEYPPQLLDGYYSCRIPVEALARRTFKVQVLGKDANGKRLTTNKIEVTQNGGKL